MVEPVILTEDLPTATGDLKQFFLTAMRDREGYRLLVSEILEVVTGNALADLDTLEKLGSAIEDMADVLAGKLAASTPVGAGTGINITGDLASGNISIAAKLATQAQAEAGTDNTTLMTPLRTSQAVAATRPIFARHSSTGVIAKQRGVSSITQLATGRFRCNFAQARADANYAPGVIGSTDGSAPRLALIRSGTITTTAFEYNFINVGGTLADPDLASVFILE